MYFEDLAEGAVYRTGSHTLTPEELHQFATAYDPQPMHLDRDFAARGPFGDVIASGFQTMALAWRLWVETGMDHHGRGGIALGDVRWHRPLYAGTEVRSVVHIEQVRITSQGKGLATMRFEVFDQDETLLLEFSTTGLFARLADEVPSPAVEG
ncbi:MAG TPA: MaoC/PaaZ C-terminal domain-containing protein [Blastococcus sp.]|jgi:acyl dehydratase